MTTRPTVSVGVPVYNARPHIAQALESILAQTYGDLEVVVLDNASTDGTTEICESFARADQRVRFTRSPINRGAFANYSEVFRRSYGSLFKWASANDWCSPGFIEACVTALGAQPDAVLSYPRTKLFSEDLAAAIPYDDELNLQQDSPVARVIRLLEGIHLNNVLNGLIRRTALEQTQLHGPYYASDVVLLCELALLGKFIEIPEYLLFRQMNPQTATKMMSVRERDAYIFGHSMTSPRFSSWRLRMALLGLVVRGHVNMSERLKLLSYVAKFVYWDLHKDFVGIAG
jgi:glycosyltransferase involved in cell wall biosynthesis